MPYRQTDHILGNNTTRAGREIELNAKGLKQEINLKTTYHFELTLNPPPEEELGFPHTRVTLRPDTAPIYNKAMPGSHPGYPEACAALQPLTVPPCETFRVTSLCPTLNLPYRPRSLKTTITGRLP